MDGILNLVGITHKICLSFLKEPISTQKMFLYIFNWSILKLMYTYIEDSIDCLTDYFVIIECWNVLD